MQTHIQPIIRKAPGSLNRRKHPSRLTIGSVIIASALVGVAFIIKKLNLLKDES